MKMGHLLPLVSVFSILSVFVLADGRVRRVPVQGDQIVTVRTALGVATIIQVPDKPNSVVVGDLNAYKVEYLDTAITIKPLSGHAKSNLYVYTDYKRFNVQLVTGIEAAADYVVYLENPKAKAVANLPVIKWRQVKKTMTNDGLTLQLVRLGENDHGLCMIDFTISSEKTETIKPEWFWLIQDGFSHPIQGLVLSSLSVNPKLTVRGTIEILRSDINESKPLRIELRRKKLSFLTIQGVKEWKR